MRKLDHTRRRLALALATGAAFGRSAAADDSVEVWVELTERPPAAGAAAAAAQQQRKRVALQQDRVGQALTRLGAIELARIHANGNAIAVRIDRARLDEVRAMADVKRVRPVRTLHPPRTGGAARG